MLRADLAWDPTLRQLLAEYARERELTAGSLQQLRISADQFSRWTAQRTGHAARVADLSRGGLLDWMLHLEQQQRLAPATINSKRAALLALWSFANEQGYHPQPAPRLKRLRTGTDPPVAWTLEQFERLLQTARGEPGRWAGLPAGLCWEIALLVAWDTGARLAEIFEAELAEVDLEAGCWIVTAAKRKGRRRGKLYRLHPQTLALIRSSVIGGEPRRRLIPWPWARRSVWPNLRKLLRKAGLPHDRRRLWHCIRRTAESYAALERGIPWAAEAVGHGEAVARRHYIAPEIVPQPSLVDALPRPDISGQLRLISG